jgi:hypothetical protein
MLNMLKTMSPLVKKFFSDPIEKMAKETKFVHRSSKMPGSLFLKTFVFGLLENATASLNDLAAFCEDHFGVAISIQGLDERIHQRTRPWMKQMFTLALVVFRQTGWIPLPLLSQFSGVNITDSTGFSLPESLAEECPGSGADASQAAAKLQLVLDFLIGGFKTITLTNGKTPDQNYTQHSSLAEPNSLNLFDLGYFVLQHLKGLADKGAYFLCRFLHGTNLYQEDGTRINLLAFLRAESRDRFELALRLGAEMLLPCRVCVFRAPDDVARRRRQIARKQAARRRRGMPSKLSLELMGWTIVVTNVPPHDDLS